MVRAKYSDGHVDDVTRWVKYSSNNEGVASVDDWGHVKMNGPGEAAVTLWYSSRVLYSRMTVPYRQSDRRATLTRNFPRHNYIDDLVIDKLKKLNIAPSKIADDSTFIRRAYLDAAGMLPTAEEVENFLADKSPDKRAKLIDRLLEQDEFVDYWAYKWSDLLLVSSRKLRPNAMWAFYDWIRDSVKQNKPWDQFTREIFTSSGSSRQNGALNYFVAAQRSHRSGGERHGSVPGPAHHVRALPQSSAREMDAEAVLPVRQPGLARRDQERRGDRRCRGVRQDLRRHQPSAAAAAAAADAAGWQAAVARFDRGPPHRSRGLADQPRESVLRAIVCEPRVGATSWAAAW